MTVFRKNVVVDRTLLDKHLRASLGEPFATRTERLHKTVEVDTYSFVDTPEPGQGTLVSLGLAGFARAAGFATEDGYAQELLMTVTKPFFTDELVEFFSRSVSVYARQRTLLTWGVPMTLANPLPGSADMIALVPAPATALHACSEPAGVTAFCRLVPLRASEAFWLRGNTPDDLMRRLAASKVDLADLRRDQAVG